jgi:hypothetical protein
MKVLRACSADETRAIWTRAIKRLIHRYREHRNEWRALWRRRAENRLAAPLEGRRWCDATERELLGNINSRGWR